MNDRILSSAESPEDTKEVRIGHRHEIAAGFPALYQTLRFALRETGLPRGVKELLKLNQKKGFDCQSCA